MRMPTASYIWMIEEEEEVGKGEAFVDSSGGNRELV